ncbi:uncharacterized protein ANIA_11581 [Aspergillus nidulans FGSC A4]|uniref:Uncharacterized protein n=1 Tax=Emericella nidulans (strain FGSC A4 / ATCC 38163 / CBS 112.46 / NRRL 194 / M139) TaxID=227321 RepID=C8V3M9_EMENI|nr:hypothetical protein [Aspergillus nidulans FGSC A4]CBF73426.1 TPA: conserved hypothetical protein [Aspergillus nidulans FGSC A4]
MPAITVKPLTPPAGSAIDFGAVITDVDLECHRLWPGFWLSAMPSTWF